MGVGYYLARTTPVPMMHLYATDITLRLGVGHPRAVLPELLEWVHQNDFPAERVTTTVAQFDDAPEPYLEQTVKLVLERPPLTQLRPVSRLLSHLLSHEEFTVEHHLRPVIGLCGCGLVVGAAEDGEAVIGAIVNLGFTLGQGIGRFDEGGVRRGWLHGVSCAETEVKGTGVRRDREVRRVSILCGAERGVEANTSAEYVASITSRGQDRASADAVANTTHCTASSNWVR